MGEVGLIIDDADITVKIGVKRNKISGYAVKGFEDSSRGIS